MDALAEALTRDWWHLVAHRSELAEPGDFVRLDWALGELVLFNDQGTVIAFDNLCPHRGARFFVEDAGNGRMACAYHGWSFRGGELRIPLKQTFDPAEVAGACLNTYQTAWCGDFLFAGVAPKRPLEDQLSEAAEPLAAVSRQIAGRRDFNAFEWKSDWRVAVENALETYHVGGVHPESLGRLGMVEQRTDYPAEGCSAYFGEVGEERVRKGLERMARFFDIDHAHAGYWSIHVFPFAMISSTFGYSYSLQLFSPAREAQRTHFSSRLLTARIKPGSEAALDGFFESTAQVNRQVFEEDHVICARVSPLYDMTKPGRVFAKSEERVRRLHATLGRLQAEAHQRSNIAR